MYCRNCGSEMSDNAAVCVKCGVALKGNGAAGTGVTGEKSKMIAGLLAIFLGHLGIHEFNLGEKKKGIAKIIATVICVFLFIIGIGFIGLIAVWIKEQHSHH